MIFFFFAGLWRYALEPDSQPAYSVRPNWRADVAVHGLQLCRFGHRFHLVSKLPLRPPACHRSRRTVAALALAPTHEPWSPLPSAFAGQEITHRRLVIRWEVCPMPSRGPATIGSTVAVAWFEGPGFRMFVRSSAEVRAEEAWLACATCLSLMETDDREGLAVRGTRRPRWRSSEGAGAIQREMQDKHFWRHRDQT